MDVTLATNGSDPAKSHEARERPPKPPFFVVGAGRSGTTLLQTLIDAHPQLAVPPESHLYDRIAPVFETYGDLAVEAHRLHFIQDLLADAYIQQWRLEVTPAEVDARITRHDRVGVVDALFSLYAEQHGATRWGDKTPDHIRWLDAIRADFPDAKLIHLVRDGRDRAEARRRMIWGPSSAFGIAQEWSYELKLWETFCERHGTRSTLVVRYEDLVTAPRETMQRIFEFLEEPYIDTVTSYASTPLTRTLSTTQRGWHSSLGRGISTRKIGIYRRALTRRQIEIFEAVAQDALLANGYRPDFSAPRPASPLERALSSLLDKSLRWYRKMLNPYAAWLEVQFRLRLAQRHLLAGARIAG
jgi:hypothetical protein